MDTNNFEEKRVCRGFHFYLILDAIIHIFTINSPSHTHTHTLTHTHTGGGAEGAGEAVEEETEEAEQTDSSPVEAAGGET